MKSGARKRHEKIGLRVFRVSDFRGEDWTLASLKERKKALRAEGLGYWGGF